LDVADFEERISGLWRATMQENQSDLVILGIVVPMLLLWTRFDRAQRDSRDVFDGLLW
jgi:hypothetical protein